MKHNRLPKFNQTIESTTLTEPKIQSHRTELLPTQEDIKQIYDYFNTQEDEKRVTNYTRYKKTNNNFYKLNQLKRSI